MTCFLLLASQTGGFVLRTDNKTAETIIAIGSLRQIGNTLTASRAEALTPSHR